MKDEFRDRLAAFRTALTFGNDPERKTVWENQVPKAFGARLGQAETMLGELEDFVQKQSASIAGAAEAKEKEEGELEQAAFAMGQALVLYFEDQGDLVAAEPFRRTLAYWQKISGEDLLLRSQEVIDAATVLTGGANAATIAENYGISAAAVTALTQERTDFAEVVSAPAATRSGRKGYTVLLREKFRPVTAHFRDLDRLVPQFGRRTGGPAFVQGWFAARNVVTTGGGSGSGGSAPAAPGSAPAAPGKAEIGETSEDGSSKWTLGGFTASGTVTG